MSTSRVKFGLKKYSGQPLPTEPTKSLIEIVPSQEQEGGGAQSSTKAAPTNEQQQGLAFRPGDLASVPATSSVEDTTIADIEIDAAAAAALPQYQAPPPVVLTLSQHTFTGCSKK